MNSIERAPESDVDVNAEEKGSSRRSMLRNVAMGIAIR